MLVNFFKERFIQEAGLLLLASANVDRDTGFAPMWYRLLILEFIDWMPSRRLALPVSCMNIRWTNWFHLRNLRALRPVFDSFQGLQIDVSE